MKSFALVHTKWSIGNAMENVFPLSYFTEAIAVNYDIKIGVTIAQQPRAAASPGCQNSPKSLNLDVTAHQYYVAVLHVHMFQFFTW